LTFAALVDERAHAREHRRRSGERRFATASAFEQLGNLERALLDRVAEIARQPQQRVASDALQDGTVEVLRENAAIVNDQKVRGAGLLHVTARKEQPLVRLPFLLRIHGESQRRGVVATGLRTPEFRRRTHLPVADQQTQRTLALIEVVADG